MLNHQPSNTIPAQLFTFCLQIFVHAESTVHAATVGMNLLHPDSNTGILGLSLAWHTRLPSVKTTGKYLQASTHKAYGVKLATALNSLIFQI